MNKLTLGSLFDGSGGFPLGGLISGIIPVWASEIEPFPIRVTTKRLPFIKHYGDISCFDRKVLLFYQRHFRIKKIIQVTKIRPRIKVAMIYSCL
jgi:site-specific DNA-cytosine methylase